MIHFGIGINFEDLDPRNIVPLYKWIWISAIVNGPATYFAKATILFMIARVFAIKKIYSICVKVFATILLVAYLVFAILKGKACTPLAHYWDASIPGTCIDLETLFNADLAFALVSDILILLLPIIPVWSLNMTRGKKLQVIALLSAGGVATAVSAVRFWRSYTLKQDKSFAQALALIQILA